MTKTVTCLVFLGQQQRRVTFEPTNSRLERARDARWRRWLMQSLGATAVLLVLITGALSHPGSVLVGFNALWLGALLGSPLLRLGVMLLDRRPRRDDLGPIGQAFRA